MLLGKQLAQPCPARQAGSARRASIVAGASRRVVAPQQRVPRRVLRTRSAEEGGEQPQQPAEGAMAQQRPHHLPWSRPLFCALRTEDLAAGQQDNPEFTHFLPLPKPAHLIYIKPTVAVVADVAPRNSVGLKMSAGDDKLERYIIEFYSKSVK